MRRTILITLTILLLGVCSVHAAWFGIETAETNPVALTVGQADENGLTIQVDLSGIEFTEPEPGYVKIALPEEGFSGEIGQPALPVINRMVRVPLGADVRLTVRGEYEELPVSTFTGAARVMPIQPSVPKIPGAREAAIFTVDASAYTVARPLFAEAAQVVGDGMLRGYRLVTLQLRPVNYVPAEETLLVARHLDIDVEFVDGDMAETRAVEERYVDPRSYAMVNNIALNATSFGEKIYPHFVPSTYLIISRPEAFNMAAVQELVEWKTQRGWNVVTVGTDETGATSQQIINYITDAYNNWAIPPSFVLLIGDTNLVTHANGTTGAATDLYYSAVSGADYMPDLGVGRLSVRNEDHLNTIIGKLLTHEKNEWNVADNSWMTHATFMASRDNFNISEGTHNAVCTNLLEPLGFTCTKVFYQHGGTTQQALDALNTGPTVHAYSGHGSSTSWADGPPVNQAQVRALTNTTYPLVFSHACSTGSYTIPECFAETWQRVPNGALAFWAGSESTYWDEDDILEKGEFYGLTRGDDETCPAIPWVSGITDFGLLKLYEHYAGGGRTKLYYEMYNLFGDPESFVYTAAAATIAPVYESELPTSTTSVSVTVPGQQYMMIGLAKDDVLYGSGYTDDSGKISIDLVEPVSEGLTLSLTVTGHNVKPFIGTITFTDNAGDDDDDDTGTDDDDTGTDDDDTGTDDDDTGDDDDTTPSGDDDDDDDDGCGA